MRLSHQILGTMYVLVFVPGYRYPVYSDQQVRGAVLLITTWLGPRARERSRTVGGASATGVK